MLCPFLCTLSSITQGQLDYFDIAELDEKTNSNSKTYAADNGFQFNIYTTSINTKYVDYAVGFYKEKFTSYSARKIGKIAKKDPKTGEFFTKLYCSDITNDYDLNRPTTFLIL